MSELSGSHSLLLNVVDDERLTRVTLHSSIQRAAHQGTVEPELINLAEIETCRGLFDKRVAQIGFTLAPGAITAVCHLMKACMLARSVCHAV